MTDERRTSSLVLVAVILATGGASAAFFGWWLPEYRRKARGSNERSADGAIHLLASAEVDFRKNDSDGNGVNDFWTGDVAGLLRYGLIDRAFAEADARPLVPLVRTPIAFNGYYFVAMELDDSETPPVELRQDTDRRSGKTHHPSRFAFCAYPAQYRVTGSSTFIINQDLTAFKGWTEGKPVLRWPSDDGLTADWAKYE
jgi:hypothetical protein